MFINKKMSSHNLISHSVLYPTVESNVEERNAEHKPETPVSAGVAREYVSNVTPNLASRYRILKVLGKGAYGLVVLGQSREDESKKVAIKMVSLKSSVRGYESFGIDASILTEVSILTKLDHPNVVKLYEIDFDQKQQVMGLVLELAKYDLLHLIDEVWFPPHRVGKEELIRERLQISYDIFCGINYLHQNGILHLDLKPQNILISEIDGVMHAKIADFGLSDRTNGIKSLGRSKVTWPYRAPELMCGSVYGPTADIWSIGVILTQIFFNINPFIRFGEDGLFLIMLTKIGVPSFQWYDKYRGRDSDSMYYCPYDDNGKDKNQDEYKDIENAIFKDSTTLGYYKTVYYGEVLYQQIIDLISRCLLFDPEQRIGFDDVMKSPLFQNQLCNCTHCVIKRGYEIPLDAPPLNGKLETVLSKSDAAVVLPYAREIFQRYVKLHSDAQNNLAYQACALSIASKILGVDSSHLNQSYRRLWARLAGFVSMQQYVNMEMQFANELHFNFDGPVSQ